MTARKYRSNSSGVCFIRPLIHHSTISTKLPNRTREIFYERYLEQKPYKTIAENFGISVKGVEFHIAKSLNILRKNLKDYL